MVFPKAETSDTTCPGCGIELDQIEPQRRQARLKIARQELPGQRRTKGPSPANSRVAGNSRSA